MNYNRAAGSAFAIWGLIHVVVSVLGMGIYATGGTNPMLEFVVLDPAVNQQADRMADLIFEFYHALFLIGLTVTVVGLTLNLAGDRLGWWLNTLLVANIEAAFIWFEVIPGHRPVAVAVISVALLLVGVGAGWRGMQVAGQSSGPDRAGEPAD